jgi:hypothetical protein
MSPTSPSRRTRLKRFSLLIVAAGLLASACQGKGALSAGPAPSGSPSPSQRPSQSPSRTSNPSPAATPTSNRKVTYQVWFTQNGKLFSTKRTELFSPGVAQLSLGALLKGPTMTERSAGVETAMTSVGTADILDLTSGLATVQMSSTFFEESGATLRMRRAQVVYTLTQFSTIRRVRFAMGDGSVLPRAWTRAAFGGLLPAILVESPIIGARVSSAVTVSGTANVFEATVSLRILDENGKEIARTFTTATCGTGCRGDYSVSVPFNVDHQQQGTIEVFESSAQDGSPINLVRIPVTLLP